MRLVLALDTATAECAIGLGLWPDDADGEPRLLGETNLSVPRAALTHAAPVIARLLEDCGQRIGDLRAIVAGRGPGSFTGVRIGIATAKGLAHGLGVPLYGVSTLDAVAERFAGRDGLVAVVGDAMRKEVYPALFRGSVDGLRRLTPDRVAKPAETAAEWAATIDEQVLVAGDGLDKYEDLFVSALGHRAKIAPRASWFPSGASLLQVAWRTGADSAGGSVAGLLPIYTRLSDAEEAEAWRAGRPTTPPGSGVAGEEGPRS